MSAQKILVGLNGPVATITINRPQVRNALDNEAARGLADALGAVERNGDVRVAVLTGAGGRSAPVPISRSWAAAPTISRGPAATKARCARRCRNR
jgi:hypothetical protein